MENKTKTEFIVDRESNTLTIKRDFAAKRELVWDCYTKSEFLEKWFAPKPLTAKTKKMDFKAGGHWLYAMIEPNGTEHWGRTDFTEIKPIDYYKSLDGFCDENGNLNPDMPRAKWLVTFTDLNEKSNVETVVSYNSLKELETVIEMRMKDGLSSTLERLDELLESLAKQ
ncbi:SRPBCC domain-containing protein [Winogradskyella sp. F6397]|uniref:SRPBCC domain-containing protein n=1 Tax=Winogradskyella marina TaxID=2785530 RepID=A0ABS0EG23_9FLAO|nr:SRPBCC domain-containing protein [Winogradskyella marina]MBF8149406.1 SRPBCC domain-containing protein [Winogradskyella marina]